MGELKVLLICNKGSKTGGPKCLHQLYERLGKEGVQVFLCDPYPFANFRRQVTDYDPHQPVWLGSRKIPKDLDLVLVPETFDRIPQSFFKRSKKIAVWWLSVDNAEFEFIQGDLEQVKYGLPHADWHQANSRVANLKRSSRKFLARTYRRLFWKKVNARSSINLFHSSYAKCVLEQRLDVTGHKLSDISETHAAKIEHSPIEKSSRMIVYNGNKGAGYVEQLAKKLTEFKFVKLQGLDGTGLYRAFSEAVFYLDLGHFPGKDRMPREAIRLGCPVILARRGSARYIDDFDIPEEYRLDIHANSPQQLADSLRVLLRNGDQALRKQEDFLRNVLLEEEVFDNEVKTLVKIIDAER